MKTQLLQGTAGNAVARGYQLKNGMFLMLAGSTIAKVGSPTVKRDCKTRQELMDRSYLVADPDPTVYRLATDYVFNSLSEAGGVVKDGNCSGTNFWFDPQTHLTVAAQTAQDKAA